MLNGKMISISARNQWHTINDQQNSLYIDLISNCCFSNWIHALLEGRNGSKINRFSLNPLGSQRINWIEKDWIGGLG